MKSEVNLFARIVSIADDRLNTVISTQYREEFNVNCTEPLDKTFKKGTAVYIKGTDKESNIFADKVENITKEIEEKRFYGRNPNFETPKSVLGPFLGNIKKNSISKDRMSFTFRTMTIHLSKPLDETFYDDANICGSPIRFFGQSDGENSIFVRPSQIQNLNPQTTFEIEENEDMEY